MAFHEVILEDSCMTRVLVTGAAGFIGSHVAEHCLARGYEVVGVDDLSGGSVDNVPAAVEFRQGTVTEYEWLASLWAEAPFDYVYHLAAYAAEGLSHFIRRFNYETNLIGSINLINLSVLHEVRAFVFTSSIAVYGANQTPMTEDLPPRPEDPYGISKYAVELDLHAAQRMFGLPFVVFRPHNVYGERQNIADKYRNVIGIFMNQVMSEQPMTIFGDGLQTRAFSHIDDVAPTIASAPEFPDAIGKTFNVGADIPYSVLDLAHRVAAAFGVEPNVKHLPAREEVAHAFASHELVRSVFPVRDPVPLDEGLSRMANWAQARGPMRAADFGTIEVERNLPPSWRAAAGSPSP
jgi:UDP-glucose 4-epimerase